VCGSSSMRHISSAILCKARTTNGSTCRSAQQHTVSCSWPMKLQQAMLAMS
jgi:hypothetical protein